MFSIGSDQAEGKNAVSQNEIVDQLDEIIKLLVTEFKTKLILFVFPICGPNPDEQTVNNVCKINLAIRDSIYRHEFSSKVRYVNIIHHLLSSCRYAKDNKFTKKDNIQFRCSVFRMINSGQINSWIHTTADNVAYSIRNYIL